jgi:hypothetical protein
MPSQLDLLHLSLDSVHSWRLFYLQLLEWRFHQEYKQVFFITIIIMAAFTEKDKLDISIDILRKPFH